MKVLSAIMIIMFSFSVSPSTLPYEVNMKLQIEWLSGLQTNSGAIRDSLEYGQYGPERYKVTPYFANIAATAMTKDSSKLPNVKQYINWYFDHLNPMESDSSGNSLYGTIYDYYVTPEGNEYSTKYFDSADAYAATFISLLRTYYEASNDKELLFENRERIAAVCSVMTSLMDKDNLTWAKADYHIKYLMDNCEVYKGFEDAAFIFDKVFSEAQLSQLYKTHGENVKAAILSTMKNGNEFYSYWDKVSGRQISWSRWYPDTTAQIFPILFGILEPSDPLAVQICGKINENWDWAGLNASKDYPWVVMGYFNAVMGNRQTVEVFYNNVTKRFFIDGNEGTKPYWNSMEGGWFVLMTDRIIANKWDRAAQLE